MKKTDLTGYNNQQVDHLFREVSGKVVAVLTRQFGNHFIEAVVDSVQDAFESALMKWRFSGIPDNPGAWILTVARRKLLNRIRKDERNISISIIDHYLEQHMDMYPSENDIIDSQLELLLTCVNLPLSQRDRIITTLHILCGFSPGELARAMGLHFEAIRKSLYRNKQKLAADTSWHKSHMNEKIKDSAASAIFEVLYALFNEGYKSSKLNQNMDIALCFEALRLLKLVMGKYDVKEGHALMSLFYFHLSRFPARIDVRGEWLTLEHQDRSLWDKDLVKAGFKHLDFSRSDGSVSTRYLEAVIASLHMISPSFDQTPWDKIEALYQRWYFMDGENTMIRLQAMTAAVYHRPSFSLADEIEELRGALAMDQHYLIDATLAVLYEKMNASSKQKYHLEQAIKKCENRWDKSLLEKKFNQEK